MLYIIPGLDQGSLGFLSKAIHMVNTIINTIYIDRNLAIGATYTQLHGCQFHFIPFEEDLRVVVTGHVEPYCWSIN